ncbi:putative MFS transporter [Meredithblackwellia eburnea MCA 4105]
MADHKGSDENLERAENTSLDAKDGGAPAIVVTEEDSKRICRKTDRVILTLLMWIYFLQILDKSVVGYAAVFGLRTHTHLVGNQYSNVGAVGYYAQLGAQPLGAFLLVKFKPRTIMPIIVFCWGASLCGMAASHDFKGLMISRFFLGLFEALCLPLFTLITVSWYRRSEQPLRVAAWYSTNGLSTILGSCVSYGLGQIKSDKLHSYQIIFLLTGLLTVLSAPLIVWRLDNSVMEARFLSEEDRLKGVERLKANQTGIASNEFKWAHIKEFALDVKTYLFLGQALCVNVGASVVNVFGPVLLQGLAGFSPKTSVLLNMPFGALQFIAIWGSSYLAWKSSRKSVIFAAFMVPCVIGSALLYAVPRTAANKGPLLLGYYFLSFLFAANPLIVSWIAANTGGQTKKSALYTLYNAGSSVGNIVGPYLFTSKDAPTYLPGVRAVLPFFVTLEVLIALTTAWLMVLNKRHEKARIAKGGPAKIVDKSMQKAFDNSDQNDHSADKGLDDLTDIANENFQYVL